MINCESHPEDRHCHDARERQHPWGSQTGVTAGSPGTGIKTHEGGRPGEPPELRFLPLCRSSREGERGLSSDLPITRQKPDALEEATASPELPGHVIQSGQRRRPGAPPPFPEPRHHPISMKEAGHREPPAGSCVMSLPSPAVRARRWGVLPTPLLPASLPLDTPNTGQPALGPRAVFSWLEKAGPVEAGALHTSLTWGQGSGLTSLPSWCCPRIRPRSLQSLQETKEIPQYLLPSAHGCWDWSRYSDGLKDWRRTLRRGVWNLAPQGHAPSGGSRETPPHLPQLLQVPGAWLVAASLQTQPPSSHSPWLLCVRVFSDSYRNPGHWVRPCLNPVCLHFSELLIYLQN